MNLTISPGQPLHGSLRLPGDKSLSHRAALFAALAEGESRIENFLNAGVTRAMLQALSALGIDWEMDTQDTLRVTGRSLTGFSSPPQPLACGNSATTLRLLAGALACSGTAAVLDGSPGLRRRPMRRIVQPLKAMGVPVQASPDGTAPLTLTERSPAQKLIGMHHILGVASAQVKTCLLLAGLAADGPTEILEPSPSRDHSERLLRRMGVSVSQAQLGHLSLTRLVPPAHSLQPLQLSLPGDISSAAFFIVAALITPGSDILIEDVLLNPGRTGLIDVLQSMGAQIEVQAGDSQAWEPCGNLRVRHSSLSGGDASGEVVVRMIDEFPAFAVAAAYAAGSLTRVRDAAELRTKESDRIQAMAELVRLGADISGLPDGFEVHGRDRLEGGTASAGGDHRMAMALSISGLASRTPVTVQGAEIIAESFPGFVQALQALGAQVEVQP